MRPVVHFEINGPERLLDFYRSVFGWKIDAMPETQYGLVDTQGGKGFNGGIGLTPDQTGVTVYIAVPDLDATLETIVAKGGEVVHAPMEIPDVVTFAMFRDPHGNAVGLVKDSAGEPPKVTEGSGAPVTWFEIMGRDVSIQDFYREVFDWKISDAAPAAGYGMVGWEEWGYGGGVGCIQEGAGSYVTIYPEVPDVDVTAVRVSEEGGEIVMGPERIENAGVRVVAFRDPAGNLVGAYTQVGEA